MGNGNERNWQVIKSQEDVGIRLGDVTQQELDSHVPLLLTIPLGYSELRLEDVEDPISSQLERMSQGFFFGHLQRLDGRPPRYSLFLVNKHNPGIARKIVVDTLAKNSKYSRITAEVLGSFPGWADPSGQALINQFTEMSEQRAQIGGRVIRPTGCLSRLLSAPYVLVDVWFSEEWNYEGQKSPAFEAIERRLVPAIHSRMLGRHEGEGSFVGRTQYNVGFIIKKKLLSAAIDVLSRELRAMGAPRSTVIEVKGRTYSIY